MRILNFVFDLVLRTLIATFWFSLIIVTITLTLKSCQDIEDIETDGVQGPEKALMYAENAPGTTVFHAVESGYRGERMKCVSRVSIPDPRTGKQGMIGVPCGKCGACRHNRRADWSYRLAQELKASKNAFFLTLTYSDENLPYNDQGLPTLQKRDYQLFIKRLRKENEEHWDEKFRYYAVGEYGSETGRPHYHIVAYNIHPKTLQKFERLWTDGHYHIGSITTASIHYVTKYHVNKSTQEEINEETGEIIERTAEFASMSRRPGIGANYVDTVADWHTDNMFSHVVNNGFKQRLPRYYKEKIFSDHQKREISRRNLEYLDEQYWREYDRLKELGIEDPDHYMQISEYKEAKRVKRKAQDGNTF